MRQPENLLTESAPFTLEITIPPASIAYRDECLKMAAPIKPIAYVSGGGNDKALFPIVEATKTLNALAKDVEKAEDEMRKPVNAKLKEIRRLRDDFLATVHSECARLTKITTDYQRAKLSHEREEQIKLEAEARKAREAEEKAAQAIRDAEAKIRQQQIDLQNAEMSKKTRALAEKKLAEMKAEKNRQELAAELAEMNRGNAEAALITPNNTPRGLTVRERFDFSISKPFAMANAHPSLFVWNAQTETLKFNRAEFLKMLNGDDATWHNLLPTEGAEYVIHAALGLKVFRSVTTFTRS